MSDDPQPQKSSVRHRLLFASAFGLGFFLVSTNPIGMQYAAEITHPTPEGTSNGLIQLFGQASVVFVYIMEALKTPDGAFTPALLLAMALLVLSTLIIIQMKDPGSWDAAKKESIDSATLS
jgi:hypothetical protein